jgi:hypothetical protein
MRSLSKDIASNLDTKKSIGRGRADTFLDFMDELCTRGQSCGLVVDYGQLLM